MGGTVKLGDTEYEVDDLSEPARAALASMQFADKQMLELNNMKSILQRAKNSYIDSLKKEMLSNKAGILFGDD